MHAPADGPSTPADAVVERFGRYLAVERGLAASTVERRSALVRRLLDGPAGAGGLWPGGWPRGTWSRL